MSPATKIIRLAVSHGMVLGGRGGICRSDQARGRRSFLGRRSLRPGRRRGPRGENAARPRP